jgi:hypothetical protein
MSPKDGLIVGCLFLAVAAYALFLHIARERRATSSCPARTACRLCHSDRSGGISKYFWGTEPWQSEIVRDVSTSLDMT